MSKKFKPIIPVALVLLILAGIGLGVGLWWSRRENIEVEARVRQIPDVFLGKIDKHEYSIYFTDNGVKFTLRLNSDYVASGDEQVYEKDGARFSYYSGPFGSTMYVTNAYATTTVSEKSVMLQSILINEEKDIYKDQILGKMSLVYKALQATP